MCCRHHATCWESVKCRLKKKRSNWLHITGSAGAYFQTSKICTESYRMAFSAKQRISSMPYGFAKKFIKTPVLTVCFSKEAKLRSWWDLIFIKKKSPPYSPPALHPPAHQQTNNPNQNIEKAWISRSNVLRLPLGGSLFKMCALQQDCHPN